MFEWINALMQASVFNELLALMVFYDPSINTIIIFPDSRPRSACAFDYGRSSANTPLERDFCDHSQKCHTFFH